MRKGLGRRTPSDWTHVDKYPLSFVQPRTVDRVNRILRPKYQTKKVYDQGTKSACVGYALSTILSYYNKGQLYDADWLWDRAKERDEWSDTNPGDNNGTSGRAAADVLRDVGAVRAGESTPDPAEGIRAYRWATSVDEIRTAIADGHPVAVGTDWYTGYNRPRRINPREYWIFNEWRGQLDGGHEWLIIGASDDRQAFRGRTTWGANHPDWWMPYDDFQSLHDANGDAMTFTDR